MHDPKTDTPEAPLISTTRSLPIALLRAREKVMGPFREMLAETGISEQKWRVLRVVHEREPVAQARIAEEACLMLPSLTRILKAMEADGMLSRETSESDRRATLVSLTDKGRALIAEHSQQSAQIAEKLAEDFGRERLEELLDLLEELRHLP